MVHTPTTVRAAELQQLHRGLTLPGLSLDERLDVLLHVKWAVKEHDCGLSRELVELIDREADLLNRCGRSGGPSVQVVSVAARQVQQLQPCMHVSLVLGQ